MRDAGADMLDRRGFGPCGVALASAAAGGLVMFLFRRVVVSRPCTCCMGRHLIRLDGGGWVCPKCDLSGGFDPVRSLQRFAVYFMGQEPGVWRGEAGA